MNEKTYIYSIARTPIGSFNGSLKSITAQVRSSCYKIYLEKSNISNDEVDEVIMGNVLSTGVGQAPARQASIYAGLSYSTNCMTVNKVCGSGLKSIMLADQSIRLGDSKVIIAGGMENMSQAPHYLLNSRLGVTYGDAKFKDSIINDGLYDPYNEILMGGCAEILNDEEKITREVQDNFAINSYKRSNLAIKNGFFK